MRIILASASPRRKELLHLMEIQFDIISSKAEEIPIPAAPKETVEELSYLKAFDVANQIKTPYFVIGADTVVSVDSEILGKPTSTQNAVKMLEKLQGRTHQVYTGVTCIIHYENQRNAFTFSEMTEVQMYSMTKQEITDYVRTKEPMDKAGAYGIQGKASIYVKKIIGDYNNVVGFPISRFYHELIERDLLYMIKP